MEEFPLLKVGILIKYKNLLRNKKGESTLNVELFIILQQSIIVFVIQKVLLCLNI